MVVLESEEHTSEFIHIWDLLESHLKMKAGRDREKQRHRLKQSRKETEIKITN